MNYQNLYGNNGDKGLQHETQLDDKGVGHNTFCAHSGCHKVATAKNNPYGGGFWYCTEHVYQH